MTERGISSIVVNESGVKQASGWMGLSFGDFNSDGHMDFFATNVGSYVLAPLFPLLGFDAGWFLGQGGGTFTKPDLGVIAATPFGWGTSTFDYDNDGDRDIIFHGSEMLTRSLELGNPGALLQNDGSANFTYDDTALANSTQSSFPQRSGNGCR